jgi:hypothetical protein
MKFELIARPCANPSCPKVFKVLESDTKSLYHSEFCREGHLEQAGKAKYHNPHNKVLAEMAAQKRKKELCQSMEKSVVTVKSGTEHGEVLKNLKNEKESHANERPVPNGEKKQIAGAENVSKRIQLSEKEKIFTPEIITTNLNQNVMSEGPIGEDKTEKRLSHIKGNTMQETKKESGLVSTKTDSNESPLEVSKTLSIVLNEEKENSIQSLNESSKLLVAFARSLIKGKVDDQGEFIQKPNFSDVDLALKCAEGARNIQKTKLDFLKFGFDIAKEKKV